MPVPMPRSRAAPWAAVAPVGSPRIPLGNTARTPSAASAPMTVDMGDVALGAAAAMFTV